MTLVLVQTKGDVGKSTLAINVAVKRSCTGWDELPVNADEQATATAIVVGLLVEVPVMLAAVNVVNRSRLVRATQGHSKLQAVLPGCGGLSQIKLEGMRIEIPPARLLSLKRGFLRHLSDTIASQRDASRGPPQNPSQNHCLTERQRA